MSLHYCNQKERCSAVKEGKHTHKENVCSIKSYKIPAVSWLETKWCLCPETFARANSIEGRIVYNCPNTIVSTNRHECIIKMEAGGAPCFCFNYHWKMICVVLYLKTANWCCVVSMGLWVVPKVVWGSCSPIYSGVFPSVVEQILKVSEGLWVLGELQEEGSLQDGEQVFQDSQS